MLALLQENTLLLLFFVTALGYTIGRINFFGIRLGSAAILFAGLFIGMLDPTLEMPLLVAQLGLVIFLYAIGLSNGANFFHTLQQQGTRQVGFILFFLTIPAAIIVVLFFLFDWTAASAAGLFAGIGTNTAALAGILDVINVSEPPALVNGVIAQAVVAYSISYPIGVIGRIIIITLCQKWWRIDYKAELHTFRDTYPVNQEIVNPTIKITRSEVVGIPLRDLQREKGWDVLLGRLKRGNHVTLVNGDTEFQLGDLIIIAGEIDTAEQIIADLGQRADDTTFADYSVYTKRRLFVSNLDIVGKPIVSLDLKERFGALVTRVQRGDSDVLATPDTILELGDRVRVLMRRVNLPEITALFGDSYQAASQVNLLSLGFGVSLGLLLGMITITLSEGIGFQLGFAGGTLIVALILGAWRRTGTLVWTLPYGANQTLQQTGLILLLAGIGVRAGTSFNDIVIGNVVLFLIGASLLVVLLTTVIALIVGVKVMKMPFGVVAGMVASQPAVYTYVAERAQTPFPNIGFTMAIPVGVITKVVYAQLLYLFLN